MDFMTALDIGASGMSADRTQLNVTAMNLANAKTTRMPGGNGPRHSAQIFISRWGSRVAHNSPSSGRTAARNQRQISE